MAPLATRRAIRYARRAWPLLLAAYRHWEQLSAEEKERYRQTAMRTVERARGRGGGRRR
jgi:hypothetical protein